MARGRTMGRVVRMIKREKMGKNDEDEDEDEDGKEW